MIAFEKLDKLGKTFAASVSKENLDAHLCWFSGVRRDTGGAGENAAADYIVKALQSYGVEYIVHEMPLYLSYPISARLEIAGETGAAFSALTHSFGRSTGPEGIEAELVYRSIENMSDVKGRIVLVDGLQEPVPTVDAYQAGAAAIVFANATNVLHNMIATPVWGTPALSHFDHIPDIPVITIGRGDGDMLKERLCAGNMRVRVYTEVKTGWVGSKLPEAIIRGSGDAEKFILAGGHYCAWEVGTTDNATGDACLLEMARILNENKEKLNRTIRIAWWPGHSHGRYAGSSWYSDTFWENLSKNCLLYYNIDSPGSRSATDYYLKHTTAEAQSFGQLVLTKVIGANDCPVFRPSHSADQSFLMLGIPSCSTYSFIPEGHEDRKPWTGGSAGGWWWHSKFDTYDKADVEILAKDTLIGLVFTSDLANTPVIPFDFCDVAEEAEAFVRKLSEKAGTSFDFKTLHAKISVFAAAAESLRDAMKRTHAADAQREINEIILKVSRILVSVTYNASGRFIHDDAEATPLREITTEKLYPVLNAAVGLPILAGKREHGFLHAEVTRAANRTCDAFDSAAQLIEKSVRML